MDAVNVDDGIIVCIVVIHKIRLDGKVLRVCVEGIYIWHWVKAYLSILAILSSIGIRPLGKCSSA